MQSSEVATNFEYLRNSLTGQIDDFKIVLPTNR